MEAALVVLSGGQDSTTCLYWAKRNFSPVSAITFDYGQRHQRELYCARQIAEMAEIPQKLIAIDTFKQLGGNALTDRDITVANNVIPNQLPNTFVAGRNLIFLTFAAAFAHARGIKHLVAGMCQTDYSGYPDCRKNSLDALQLALNLGMDAQITIHTPLMWLSKAESIHLAQEVGAMSALKYSHTCYNNQSPPCGQCPACVLRAKGFAEAGIPDPAI